MAKFGQKLLRGAGNLLKGVGAGASSQSTKKSFKTIADEGLDRFEDIKKGVSRGSGAKGETKAERKPFQSYEEFHASYVGNHPGQVTSEGVPYEDLDSKDVYRAAVKQDRSLKSQVRQRSDKNPLDNSGILSTASTLLFPATGEFIGGNLVAAVQSMELLTDKRKRDALNNLSPEEFSQIYPNFSRIFEGTTREFSKELRNPKQFIGNIGAVSLELASAAQIAAGGSVPTAGARIGIATALGTASGAFEGLRRDESAGKIGARAVTGGVVAAAFSSAIELAAAAGRAFSNQTMRNVLQPGGSKSDQAKMGRLVNDKDLIARLNEIGIKPGTSSSIADDLSGKLDLTSTQLDDILAQYSDDITISGDDLGPVLDDLLNSRQVPLDTQSRAIMQDLIDDQTALYKGTTFDLPEVRAEKTGIGRRLGEKGFINVSQQAATKANLRKTVDRATYNFFNEQMINGVAQASGDAAQGQQVITLNNQMSTLIDSVNLVEVAGKKANRLMTTLFVLAGAGIANASKGERTPGEVIKDTAIGLGTGFGLQQAAGSAVANSTANVLSEFSGKVLTSDLMNVITNRIAVEAGKINFGGDEQQSQDTAPQQQVQQLVPPPSRNQPQEEEDPSLSDNQAPPRQLVPPVSRR